MVAGGYGKLLELNLSSRKLTMRELDDETKRKYVGGVGIAAKLVWDETEANTDPLSPENPLIFSIGPLTGVNMPSSSRYVVAGLSPLTGLWGEAHSGGDWADELKHAGFDGIIVRGKTDKPVYLWVHDGKAEIRDAGHLWGKDTYEVSDLLQRETDEKASVACIGPAGERLVRLACVMNDGRKGRAAARCGLGALMGSKKLKAIVVRGTTPIKINDETSFKDSVNKIYSSSPAVKDEEDIDSQVETIKGWLRTGRGSARNWLQGTFEPGFQLADDLYKTKPLHCRHCPYPCMDSHLTAEGERHMVWELLVPLGSQCLVGDAKVLQRAYAMCNRYGLDTISTGGVVSFAMECFEKGFITKKDTGGLELRWGDGEAMVELVRRIGLGEGFGKLLGEGVKRAADQIGGLAPEYAIHCKGLELPAHDPRSIFSVAVGYATSSLGGCHQEASAARRIEEDIPSSDATSRIMSLVCGELDIPQKLSRFDPADKGRLVAKIQDLTASINSLVVCRFSLWRIPPSLFVDLMNSVTGWDMDVPELLRVGERNINLKRMLLVRRGISRKEDTLPPRLLTHKLPNGGAAGMVPPLGAMLNEYYSVRGWTEEGVPSQEKLKELELEFCSSYALPRKPTEPRLNPAY